MQKIKIKGGKPLNGAIKAAGAKNAMTKLLVASLISNKKIVFTNVPNIGDVEITLELCKEIGMEVVWDKEERRMEVITPELKTTYIPQRFSGSNRIPILMIGALLGRTSEEMIVPTLGGDALGERPLNFHIEALKMLGAQIEYRKMKKEGAYFAHAHDGLKGNIITLPFPSVGATENSILAGISARGTTVIRNAAIEPEIVDLILFLQKMGAEISIEGDRTIRMKQMTETREVEHHVLTDRNEVVSYALAAVTTKGRVFVENAQHLNLISFLSKLRECGGGFDVKRNGIEFYYENPLKGGIVIETDVHPGFMTDWQQPFVVLLTQSEGLSIIHETVYENRFGYTKTLNEMGADTQLFTGCLGGKTCRFAASSHQHSLVVKGSTPLRGKEISIPDLRAGFAYVMAGLIAEDITVISGAHLVSRGYEEFDKKLKALGADIELLEDEEKKSSPLKPLLSKLTKECVR